MSTKSDVVVIGGGHNSLTAAILLAKRGRSVSLFERRENFGGLAAGEEFHEGFRTGGILHDTSQVWPEMVDALGLEGHGLKLEYGRTPFFVPETAKDAERAGVYVHEDPKEAAKELMKYSEKDAETYGMYRDFIDRVSDFVIDLLSQRTLQMDLSRFPDVMSGMTTALKLRSLGKNDMLEVIKSAPMCIADTMHDLFKTEIFKAAYLQPGVFGAFTGPWSPFSTLNLLLWECNSRVRIAGGGQALAKSLVSSAETAGVNLQASLGVKEIWIEEGRAKGVILDNGDQIEAETVVSGCDPRATFLKLIHPRNLSARLEDRIRVFRMRGSAGKVHLALNAPLEFKCRKGDRFEFARTGKSVDDVERSFDAMKYGKMADTPTLDIWVPSVSDPSLAPEGKEVVSVIAHGIPFELRAGWSDSARTEMGKRVVSALKEYDPDIEGKILAQENLTPKDLEDRYGLTGGHLLHGEHAPDQLLMMRPAPECSQHRTPIPGLYLCSGGAHPGGGLTCGAGALAAEAVWSRK